ncbi:hypothetical protein QYF50_06860 [Paenibacillus vini]|uniref:hypothetical protein n=1 Tax=Paenibacillus vini TaxID=1476024 RepID=UPI0025B70819|nr:hypothetical protein [Paenibacillus vini]MDN4067611.1 hypothetical protein [Paenibacillus vini]
MKDNAAWVVGLSIMIVVLGVGSIFTINMQKSSTSSNSIYFSEKTYDWQNNGKEKRYITQLLEGDVDTMVKGTVKTDTDCEADEAGISRCHNQIELENKKTVTVINIHNMQNFSCFSPGDEIEIQPLAEGWVTTVKTKGASVHETAK